MNVVDMKKVYKSYEGGKIKALNGIDLTITEGEFVSILFSISQFCHIFQKMIRARFSMASIFLI